MAKRLGITVDRTSAKSRLFYSAFIFQHHLPYNTAATPLSTTTTTTTVFITRSFFLPPPFLELNRLPARAINSPRTSCSAAILKKNLSHITRINPYSLTLENRCFDRVFTIKPCNFSLAVNYNHSIKLNLLTHDTQTKAFDGIF